MDVRITCKPRLLSNRRRRLARLGAALMLLGLGIALKAQAAELRIDAPSAPLAAVAEAPSAASAAALARTALPASPAHEREPRKRLGQAVAVLLLLGALLQRRAEPDRNRRATDATTKETRA